MMGGANIKLSALINIKISAKNTCLYKYRQGGASKQFYGDFSFNLINPFAELNILR